MLGGFLAAEHEEKSIVECFLASVPVWQMICSKSFCPQADVCMFNVYVSVDIVYCVLVKERNTIPSGGSGVQLMWLWLPVINR